MSSGSISSDSSAFSFCHLISDVPFTPSNLDDIGSTARSSVVEERVSTVENVNPTPPRKRDLRRKQQSYPLPLPPGATPNSKSQESPWKKGKLIYRGLLGGIYLGFNREKGGMCAMKEVPLSSDGDKNQTARMLEKEIALLSHMRHSNIVQYYGSEMVDGKFYIYCEYMSRGTISMILGQYGRLGESAIRSYTHQILSGLAYMHSKSITHGDIKGSNILIDPNGRLKLINLGIEKQIAKEKFHISWLMNSPYWMAPEVIMNPNVRNSAVDIWSLGCSVVEMATSKPPLSQYEGVMAMFKVAYHKELPIIPDHLSDTCKDFLRHCLRWNPLHRPTACQLLEHPFVKGLSPLEGTDNSRNPRQLVSGKVVSPSSNGSSSDIRPSDIYTPRNILSPTSLVGSHLLHARSPQLLSRGMSPPSKYTPSTPTGGIQHPRLNQSTLHQEAFRDFSKHTVTGIQPLFEGYSGSRDFHELVLATAPQENDFNSCRMISFTKEMERN